MIDFDQSDWVSLCYIDDKNEICFTKEYLDIIGHLGWEARKFAANLIGEWNSESQTILDYFGPDDVEEDWYTGIDGEAMDVGELVPDTWEVRGIPFNGIEAEWHRDVLRSKLASIKLPKKLIVEYVNLIENKQKRK